MPDKPALEQDYKTLGLKPGATIGEIRRAYLTLVKIWHPDRFPTDPHFQKEAQEKIRAINQAYTQLWATRSEEPVHTARPGTQFQHFETLHPFGQNNRSAPRSSPFLRPRSIRPDLQKRSQRYWQVLQAENGKPARLRGDVLLLGLLLVIIVVQVLSAIFPWFGNLVNSVIW